MAAWEICGVDLNPGEEPDEGQIPFARQHNYVTKNAYGSTRRLTQQTFTDSLVIRLHLLISRETKDALKAQYDAHAADGTLSGLFICPEPPYDVGVLVKITGFDPQWNGSVRGLPWFDCDIVLTEAAEAT